MIFMALYSNEICKNAAGLFTRLFNIDIHVDCQKIY